MKWIEDRAREFHRAAAERDQVWDIEAAFDADGRLLGIRGRLYHDHGAATPYGVALPYNAATNLIGPYVLPAYRHRYPVLPDQHAAGHADPRRRPAAGHLVMERLLDRGAALTGLARDEIRRRNLIPAEKMPYPTPVTQRDGSADDL